MYYLSKRNSISNFYLDKKTATLKIQLKYLIYNATYSSCHRGLEIRYMQKVKFFDHCNERH